MRLPWTWADKLDVRRGDLIRVASENCSGVYMLRMSRYLADGEIALGYDQRVDLVITSRGYEPVRERELEVRKAGRVWGSMLYLWQHIDPAVRFPFQLSVWLFVAGLLLGALVSVGLEHSLTGLLGKHLRAG